MRVLAILWTTAAVVLTGCTPAAGPDDSDPSAVPVQTPIPSPAAPTSPPAAPTATPDATARAEPTTDPTPRFRARAAARTVAALAAGIGSREGSSASFREAARLVRERFEQLGYEVTAQTFPVPAGVSWGVPVPAGRSRNLVATLPATMRSEPHLLVGAHLDTVPQAPGAADNASGIALMLEVARMAALAPPPQPVVFVAFGAEEPRGPGDDLHHFGSQVYAQGLTAPQRDALIGAIAVDTVGISDDVPVCAATEQPGPFVRAVRASGRQAGLPVRECTNRTSDHWSFVRNGLPGVRVGLAGLDEYPEYHSAADTPAVVDPARLARAGEVVWQAVRRDWRR